MLVTTTALSTLEARWHRLVQYRYRCEECGEWCLCAVVPWHGDRVRLCLSCYKDGLWRTGR